MSGWLMCGLLVLTLWARVVAASPPAFSRELERALGLLQYVASDYAAAISDTGKLISAEEYAEQLDLLSVVQSTLEAHHDARVAPLANEARALHAAAMQRVPPSQFKPRTQRLHSEIIRLFEVSLTPRIVPTLAAGRILYRQACTQCHGEDGRADTPHARTLEPRPRNFLSPEAGERLSPYQVFNVMTFGVAGTSMASFETLEETERWDLAFYVLSLRHSSVVPAVAPPIATPTLADLARATDVDLERLLSERTPAERAALVAEWRHRLPTDLGR